MTNPILLCKITIASLWPTWVSHGQGIWYTDFSGGYPLVDPTLSAGIATKLFTTEVTSVAYDGNDLLQLYTLAGLSVDNRFYWDTSARILYASFPDFNPPNESVRVGISIDVANDFYDDGEGNIYAEDMLNVPPLTSTKDRLFFKELATPTWELQLNNAEHTYDNFKDWGAYNQKVQYYIGDRDAAFSTFLPIKAGRVKDFTYSDKTLTINVQDSRAALTAKAPPNLISLDSFPNASEDLIGKPIPMAFGSVRNVEPICVNSEDTLGPYRFQLVDSTFGALSSITEVRVDDVVVTPASIVLADGYFTLTSAQCKSDSSFKDVRVDFVGYAETNPLDIISALVYWTTGIDFNSTFYDTVQWAAEKATKSNCGLYIDTQSTVLSLIGLMMTSTRGGFIVARDGRYSFKTPDYAAAEIVDILDDDWIEEPEVEYDTDEVLGATLVGYNKNYAEDEYVRVEDASYKTEVRYAYGIVDSETFDTQLLSESAAVAYASTVMELSKSPAALVSGRVGIEFLDAEPGYNFKAKVNRLVKGEYQTWLGEVTGEILEVAIEVETASIALVLRVIE